MSFADRVERDLEQWDREMRAAHNAGEHFDDASRDPDCPQCQREQRDALNREGDPAFNGSFR